MRKLSVLAALLLLFLASVAQAQTPAPEPVPQAMPFDIPYGTPITLERCKKVLEAAMAEAKRRNWKLAVAVVEPAGNLVCFEKMDGAQLSSSLASQGKARTPAAYRRPSKAFFDAMESGHPYVATLPDVVASPGGEPLIENGKLIGAIGVAGAAGPQDGVVAKAAAETIK